MSRYPQPGDTVMDAGVGEDTATLQNLYDQIMGDFTEIYNEDDIMEVYGKEIDDLFLKLKVWGADIHQDTGSLSILESDFYDEAAMSVRAHFENIVQELGEFKSADIFSADGQQSK
jgi:hypothetical protein